MAFLAQGTLSWSPSSSRQPRRARWSLWLGKLAPIAHLHTSLIHVNAHVENILWAAEQLFVTVTKYLRLGNFQTTEMYYSDLEAGKSEIKASANSVSDKDLFHIDCACCVSSHMAQGVNGLPRTSFMRALIPFMRTELSWPNHLPKPSPLNIITVKIVLCISWGCHN
jgi:hypothetical protein